MDIFRVGGVQRRYLSLCKNSKDPPATQEKEIALFPTETAEIEYPTNLAVNLGQNQF